MKNPLIRVFLLPAIFLLLISNCAYSKTIFVSTTGSDSNSGKESSPLQTIQKAIKSIMASGDEILIAPGDYHESIMANGNSSNINIKIRALKPGVNIISSNEKPALSLKNANGWLIEGLTLSGGEPSVINAYASENSRIENCTITGASQNTPIANGIAVLSSPKFAVVNSKIEVFCKNSLNLSNSKELLVKGNDISHAKSNSITFSKGCDSTVVEENYFHDKIAPGTDENCIIECRDNVGSVIRRNLIVEKKDGAFLNAILIRGPSIASKDIVIENNTLIGGKKNRGISFASNTISTVLRNNIVSGCGISVASVFGEGALPQPGVKINYNNFYNPSVKIFDDDLKLFDIGKNNIKSDPSFADSTSYKLKAGSPCIDAGDPSSSVPQGGGKRVDIGRY